MLSEANASVSLARASSLARTETRMNEGTSLEIDDELRPEYDLSKLLKEGVRGKYAERDKAGANLVLLAPDVAQAFPSEEAVNQALRL